MPPRGLEEIIAKRGTLPLLPHPAKRQASVARVIAGVVGAGVAGDAPESREELASGARGSADPRRRLVPSPASKRGEVGGHVARPRGALLDEARHARRGAQAGRIADPS